VYYVSLDDAGPSSGDPEGTEAWDVTGSRFRRIVDTAQRCIRDDSLGGSSNTKSESRVKRPE